MSEYIKIGRIVKNPAGQIYIKANTSNDHFDLSKFIGKDLFICEPTSHNATSMLDVVGNRLRLAMASREGLQTQYALAKASGVPQPTIKRILDGASKEPKKDTLLPLANVLQINFLWLRDGTGHMYLPTNDYI